MLLKIAKFLLALTLLGTLALGAAAAWVYFDLLPELPSIERLEDVRLQVPLRVYARDGALLAEFGEKRRRPLAIEDTPDMLINAFLAAEVDLRRGGHAIGAVAEIDLVQVQLEDLVLAEAPLDLQCQQDLLDLADVGLFGGEKEVTGDLHSDRAAALLLFAGGREAHRRTRDTLIVDARERFPAKGPCVAAQNR